MRKTIFFFFALMVTVVSFAQMKDSEIAKLISNNAGANLQNGVKDPNLIYAGQNLRYTMADGFDTTVLVSTEAESQWTIIRDRLASSVATHGKITSSTVVGQEATPTLSNPVEVPTSANTTAVPWIWMLAASFLFVMFYLFHLSLKQKKAKQDPVNSGPAMRQGGVRSEDALNYATQVAQRQFGNRPNLQVREVQKGMLSGENLEVFYAGNVTPQRRTFSNQPAYRGIVNVNGTEQFVYFLQGCGNDVRMGNYFSGQNIQFIPDVNTETVNNPATETQNNPAATTTPTAMVSPIDLTAVLNTLAGTGQAFTVKFQGLEIDVKEKKVDVKNETLLLKPSGNNSVAEKKEE